MIVPFIRSVALAGLAACAMTPAAAQTRIGSAATVQNEVRGEISGRTMRVGLGDSVYQNQILSTGADSGARLVFLDFTNMSLGANSRATLDRFAYSGDSTARAVTISVTRGAFRFISGESDSRAYRVQTPTAVIGVRGTMFDVRIAGGRTEIVLQEGEVQVCLRANPRQCQQLTLAGAALAVTAGAISASQTNWSFASVCSAAQGLCGQSKFAEAPQQQDNTPSFQPPNLMPLIAVALPIAIGVAVGVATRRTPAITGSGEPYKYYGQP